MKNKRYTCIRLNTFLIKMSFDLHIGKIHWVNVIVVYIIYMRKTNMWRIKL